MSLRRQYLINIASSIRRDFSINRTSRERFVSPFFSERRYEHGRNNFSASTRTNACMRILWDSRPSSTREEYDEYGDREYRAAERLGEQAEGAGCHALYPECRRSVLDVFSTFTTWGDRMEISTVSGGGNPGDRWNIAGRFVKAPGRHDFRKYEAPLLKLPTEAIGIISRMAFLRKRDTEHGCEILRLNGSHPSRLRASPEI